MSRFYGSVTGSAKNDATRQGHDRISGHVRGWNVGVKVVGHVNESDQDVFYVYATGGSNGETPDKLIVVVAKNDNGTYFVD